MAEERDQQDSASAKEAYDQGHIVGAINLPQSDVDARVNELPKNKLIGKVFATYWPPSRISFH